MPHLEGLTEDRIRSRAKRVKNFLHYGRQPQKRFSGRTESLGVAADCVGSDIGPVAQIITGRARQNRGRQVQAREKGLMGHGWTFGGTMRVEVGSRSARTGLQPAR
jgi:hypothetical protein